MRTPCSMPRPIAALRRGLVAMAVLFATAVGPAVSHGSTLEAEPPAAAQQEAANSRWDRELTRRKRALARRSKRDLGAIADLLGLVGELGGEVRPAELLEFTRGVSEDRGRHPLVRSYAGYQHARLLADAGDISGAKAGLNALGYLLSWQVVGPFDNSNRRGEATAYGPESEPYDPDQTFVGKLAGESLPWRLRDYDSIPRDALVALDDLLRPEEQATGYATCWIKLPRATRAALTVGSGGPYRVWIDGEPIGEGTEYRGPHPLQDTHGVDLEAGWHRILIKLSVLDGVWGFTARLSDADGAPIVGLETASAPPAEAVVAGKAKPATTVASVRDALERVYRSSPARGIDLLAFDRYVERWDRNDRAGIELAHQIEGKVRSVRSAWLLAIIERDPAKSLRALEQAIARARKSKAYDRDLMAQMLLELAWRKRALGLDQRYRELLEEARSIAKNDALTDLAWADRVAEDGFGWWALRQVETAATRYRRSRSVAHEWISRLRALGRTEQALAVIVRLREEHGGNSGLIAEQIEILLALGRADEATELAHEAARVMPGLPEAHAFVAHLERARGNLDVAQKALAKAIALAPQGAELHADLGRLLIRAGASEAAAASLRRSLALMPQQPEIRDLLATVDTAASRDIFARHALDFEAVAAQPTPATWSGKASGYLRHRVAVRVLPNGLTERLDHRIIRILDERGARGEAVQAVPYDPVETQVEVRRARVRRKDGTVEDLGSTETLALTSPGYRMYYDQRLLRVVLPGLRPGDTIEIAFVSHDVAARNMFDEYFGDMVALQGIEPRKLAEYILEAPAARPIYFNVKPKVSRSRDGRTVLYRYALADVPGIQPEPGIVGWAEMFRFVHASTYRTWNDVGNWYWDLVREQLVVDDAIRAAVAEALEGLGPDASVEAKANAIYTYVVRNTRYVGLEFGIHGFKPYRTTDVLSRRFGDCKDKASLLKVMLAEAGIASHLVLVRTRDQGRVDGKPASLALFNHAITYVPAIDRFMDGTAEWSGPNELPALDQGASVLIVSDGKGATFKTIPFSKPEANVEDIRAVVKLDPKGAATVSYGSSITGVDAAGMRQSLQSELKRHDILAKQLGELYPSAEVTKVRAPDIGDINRPATIEATFTVPRWATSEPAGLRFAVLGRELGFTSALAPLAARRHALELNAPVVERWHFRYELPPGHRFSSVPQSKRFETPAGRFQLEVALDDRGAVVQSSLELSERRIEPGEYPQFREFLQRVDSSLQQTFRVVVER